jgi:glyoxylase-like metal-dependent hydrolase (beta-lactamase superfamily II)
VWIYYIDAPSPAIVDAGFASSPDTEIRAALAAIGARLEDLRYVINTHGHWDHAGGDRPLQRGGARIALHRDDARLVQDREAGVADMARLFHMSHDDMRSFLFEHVAGDVQPDRELVEGDIVDLGLDVQLKIVHLPGHTRGSIAIWWEQEKLAFVGDAVQGAGNKVARCPIFTEPIAYRASIRKLGSIGIEKLCGAHRFRWGPDGAEGPLAVGATAVAAALRISAETEALLADAASRSLDPATVAHEERIANALGWDGSAVPGTLPFTLQGYSGGPQDR